MATDSPARRSRDAPLRSNQRRGTNITDEPERVETKPPALRIVPGGAVFSSLVDAIFFRKVARAISQNREQQNVSFGNKSQGHPQKRISEQNYVSWVLGCRIRLADEAPWGDACEITR